MLTKKTDALYMEVLTVTCFLASKKKRISIGIETYGWRLCIHILTTETFDFPKIFLMRLISKKSISGIHLPQNGEQTSL